MSAPVRAPPDAELCARFLPLVRVFARRRLRDSDAAEDFAQDVMEALLAAVREGKVRDPEALGSFVLGICRNLHAGRLRREARAQKRLEPVESFAEPAPVLVPRWKLEDCLARLTPRSLQVLHGSFCLDEDSRSIGERLALSMENVRVLRHRAIAQLRSCIEGERR